MRRALGLPLLVAALALAPRPAAAYERMVGVEWAGALRLGGGAPVSGPHAGSGWFELGLRVDALLGKMAPDRTLDTEQVAGGFYVSMRALDFRRGDFTAGIQGMTPRWNGIFGRVSFGGGGRAGDSALPSGGEIEVNLSGGIRMPGHAFGAAVLSVYLEGRAIFTGLTTGEIVAGVEISPIGWGLQLQSWLKSR